MTGESGSRRHGTSWPPRYRGVTYDTGTNFATGQGELSRTVWSTERMTGEVRAVAERLHANSITVYGSDLGRLEATARAAADHGLHVRLQPRLVDRPQDEVLEHLAAAAAFAGRMRREGAAIAVNAGCVASVFVPGIVPGERYHERMANIFAAAEHRVLTPTGAVDLEAGAQRLNSFLDRAVKTVRREFDGEVGYAAAPFEDVDWRMTDVIGLMHFYTLQYPADMAERCRELQRYRAWGKPVLIAEFGTATWAGAGERAFMSFDIVDRTGAAPVVVDGVVRDEDAQADFHLSMLETFEQAGIDGVAVAEFIHPTHPWSPDPRFDLDAASMAITRTVRADYADPDSAYHWEPKASFHALADYYADARRASAHDE
ncbi:abortive infection protein [Actinoplanes sp. LDG1-06]|uniref:Abortive infection protein n=1 Tax=Paractinoplanes ovalisporus TaxID=2810368 RepID=A0ABS2AK05_9ACTN|nr:abortive infection protein [Actinoplanes ovalisporus]MBM2620140.1 abortive infection protein [Actinoplanes ovalisporus]